MNKIGVSHIDIGSEVIGFRKVGIGAETVVLIHGNMSSSLHFDMLISELSKDFTVYAFDLRGMGASSYHQRFDSLHELADDIHQAFKQLELKQVHLLGWSTGGGVAMSMAARYHDDVKSLTLMSSVGLTGYPIYRKNESFQPIPGEPLTTKEEIETDPVQVAPVLRALAARDKTFYKNLWNQLIYTAGNTPSETAYDLYLDDMLTQKNLVDIDYALTRFNISSKHNGLVDGDGTAQRITQPTLLLIGDNDLVVPKYMFDEIEAEVPGIKKCVILKDCGHNPMVDAFTELINLVKEHIYA